MGIERIPFQTVDDLKQLQRAIDWVLQDNLQRQSYVGLARLGWQPKPEQKFLEAVADLSPEELNLLDQQSRRVLELYEVVHPLLQLSNDSNPKWSKVKLIRRAVSAAFKDTRWLDKVGMRSTDPYALFATLDPILLPYVLKLLNPEDLAHFGQWLRDPDGALKWLPKIFEEALIKPAQLNSHIALAVERGLLDPQLPSDVSVIKEQMAALRQEKRRLEQVLRPLDASDVRHLEQRTRTQARIDYINDRLSFLNKHLEQKKQQINDTLKVIVATGEGNLNHDKWLPKIFDEARIKPDQLNSHTALAVERGLLDPQLPSDVSVIEEQMAALRQEKRGEEQVLHTLDASDVRHLEQRTRTQARIDYINNRLSFLNKQLEQKKQQINVTLRVIVQDDFLDSAARIRQFFSACQAQLPQLLSTLPPVVVQELWRVVFNDNAEKTSALLAQFMDPSATESTVLPYLLALSHQFKPEALAALGQWLQSPEGGLQLLSLLDRPEVQNELVHQFASSKRQQLQQQQSVLLEKTEHLKHFIAIAREKLSRKVSTKKQAQDLLQAMQAMVRNNPDDVRTETLSGMLAARLGQNKLSKSAATYLRRQLKQAQEELQTAEREGNALQQQLNDPEFTHAVRRDFEQTFAIWRRLVGDVVQKFPPMVATKLWQLAVTEEFTSFVLGWMATPAAERPAWYQQEGDMLLRELLRQGMAPDVVEAMCHYLQSVLTESLSASDVAQLMDARLLREVPEGILSARVQAQFLHQDPQEKLANCIKSVLDAVRVMGSQGQASDQLLDRIRPVIESIAAGHDPVEALSHNLSIADFVPQDPQVWAKLQEAVGPEGLAGLLSLMAVPDQPILAKDMAPLFQFLAKNDDLIRTVLAPENKAQWEQLRDFLTALLTQKTDHVMKTTSKGPRLESLALGDDIGLTARRLGRILDKVRRAGGKKDGAVLKEILERAATAFAEMAQADERKANQAPADTPYLPPDAFATLLTNPMTLQHILAPLQLRDDAFIIWRVLPIVSKLVYESVEKLTGENSLAGKVTGTAALSGARMMVVPGASAGAIAGGCLGAALGVLAVLYKRDTAMFTKYSLSGAGIGALAGGAASGGAGGLPGAVAGAFACALSFLAGKRWGHAISHLWQFGGKCRQGLAAAFTQPFQSFQRAKTDPRVASEQEVPSLPATDNALSRRAATADLRSSMHSAEATVEVERENGAEAAGPASPSSSPSPSRLGK